MATVHSDCTVYGTHFIGFRNLPPTCFSMGPRVRAPLFSWCAGVFLYDEQKRGTWSDSEAERLCRAVHKFARTRALSLEVRRSRNYLRLFPLHFSSRNVRDVGILHNQSRQVCFLRNFCTSFSIFFLVTCFFCLCSLNVTNSNDQRTIVEEREFSGFFLLLHF